MEVVLCPAPARQWLHELMNNSRFATARISND